MRRQRGPMQSMGLIWEMSQLTKMTFQPLAMVEIPYPLQTAVILQYPII